MTVPRTRRSPAATGLRDRTYNASRRNRNTAIYPLQRFHDWRREQRIRHLSAELFEAYNGGNKIAACWIDAARIAEILSRSSLQVARMEAKLITRIRRVVKVRTMGAFLRGHVPASLVIALFRALRLRGV